MYVCKCAWTQTQREGERLYYKELGLTIMEAEGSQYLHLASWTPSSPSLSLKV